MITSHLHLNNIHNYFALILFTRSLPLPLKKISGERFYSVYDAEEYIKSDGEMWTHLKKKKRRRTTVPVCKDMGFCVKRQKISQKICNRVHIIHSIVRWYKLLFFRMEIDLLRLQLWSQANEPAFSWKQVISGLSPNTYTENIISVLFLVLCWAHE